MPRTQGPDNAPIDLGPEKSVVIVTHKSMEEIAEEIVSDPHVTHLTLMAELPDHPGALFKLGVCKNLKHLTIDGDTHYELDLRFLEYCPQLEILDIREFEGTRMDLSPVGHFLRGAKWIDIDYCRNVEKIDLSPLGSTPHLESLCITLTSLKGIDLTPLSRLSGLTELVLGTDGLPSIDLSPLAATALTTLELGGNNLTGVDLSPLRGLRKLSELGLGGNHLKSIDLSPLAKSGLVILDLGGNELEEVDLSPVADCPLHNVYLDSNPFMHLSLAPLSGCMTLRILSLGGNQLADVDLTPLESCSALSELRLSSKAQLTSMHSTLKTIDLKPLRRCRELKELDLFRHSLMAVDLSPLAECRELETLKLGQNQLRSLDLSPLSRCRRLRVLDLAGNRISAIDLKPLQNHPEIEVIHLQANGLESVDLTPLASCIRLWSVNIWNNPIVDLTIPDFSPRSNPVVISVPVEIFHSDRVHSAAFADVVYEPKL